MANISSYNQLSNWNEDDDLLFVQQPDAPKKAHPSQMKEYILEGLDVESVGGTGKYISAISEADGKISATAETMDEVPTQDSNKPVKSGGVYTALTSHDNATVQQLNIYKANNTVSIYGLLSSLDSTKTLIEYATLDAKYRPASGYAIGVLFSTTAPYMPVGTVWIQNSTGKVSVYKEAARTDGYLYMTYLA